MIAELTLLLAIAALIAAAPVVGQLRALAPQIVKVQADLAAAPQARELRYTIREVIVARDTAAVVAFPQRLAPPSGSPVHWRKAA